MSASRTQDALRNCFLFSSLADKEIEEIAKVSAITNHAKGSNIFTMGDAADGLRIVLDGVVRVWISDAEGHELTVTLLEKGDNFGEIALFDELPRTASATAVEKTQCLFVPRSAADALLKSNPIFAKEVIQILCETLRRNTDEMGGITFLSLEARLAQKLCDLAVSYAEIKAGTARFTRKFSQSDLAKMLGVTREAINKRLNVLIQDNLIEVHAGYISIPNLDRLSVRKK